MGRYIARRLLMVIPTLLGVYTVLFLLLWALPGSPARVIAGTYSTRESILELKKQLHLDDPLHIQWARYLYNVARGDLGISYTSGQPVMKDLMERLPATIELTTAAMLINVLIGTPLGIGSAMNRNSILDHIGRQLSVLGMSVPTFWLALILMLFFSFRLHLTPIAGRGTWKHIILPALSLGIVTTASVARMTRSSVLEVITEQYVLTARAKGLKEMQVIIVHVLRNAMIPIITVVGYQFGMLLTSSIIIETIFAWPGVGRLLIQSILNRDFPTVQGTVLVIATIFILINLIVDISYAYLDPRVRDTMA